jgi:hypothetical protein
VKARSGCCKFDITASAGRCEWRLIKLAPALFDQVEYGRNNRLTSIVGIPFSLSKDLEHKFREINVFVISILAKKRTIAAKVQIMIVRSL